LSVHHHRHSASAHDFGVWKTAVATDTVSAVVRRTGLAESFGQPPVVTGLEHLARLSARAAICCWPILTAGGSVSPTVANRIVVAHRLAEWGCGKSSELREAVFVVLSHSADRQSGKQPVCVELLDTLVQAALHHF